MSMLLIEDGYTRSQLEIIARDYLAHFGLIHYNQSRHRRVLRHVPSRRGFPHS
jgi:hypothetical protein